MAKLSLLLAVSQLTLVYSRPARDIKRQSEVLEERAVTISTNLEATTSYSTAIETLQTATITTRPSLTGTILTALPTGGGLTKNPADPPGVTRTVDPLYPEETPLVPGPTSQAGQPAQNIFVPLPLATSVPDPSIPFRDDHPVQKKNIVDGDTPLQTNKFYANFFLDSQQASVWTHPYSLSWAKGRGGSYGMAISHTERSQFSFGPDEKLPQYFISPIGIQHMSLSSADLGESTVMTVEGLKAFSAYTNFASSAGSRNIMTVPVVQGMGFITAIYDNTQPILSSSIFFRTVQYNGSVDDANITFKYCTQLEDNSRWLIYVTPLRADGVPPMTLQGGSTIRGPNAFTGLIQVTKNPSGLDGERYLDGSAGSYATEATISGSVNGPSGSYTLSWTKGGVLSRPLIMYALPHHIESFDQETRGAITGIQLVTTTKGAATAVQADSFTMIEPDLPTSIGFAPWEKAPNGAQGGTENINLAASALQLVNDAGTTELAQDFISQTSLNSMYFSGKGLAKFAGVIYTMQTMAGNSNLAAAGLEKLKDAFNVFVNNTQPEPLVYDTVWKGVVSGASYRSPTKDLGLDFGNTAYNDHHFHFGYFVYTAAVIGHLDPAWLDQGTNRQWVNTLVRDYASPVTDDYFPFSRSFDWFHGHSWAKGLFESSDGKDQESTSEDTFATFALKMWGKISGDPNMEARGNLQLAVQARSMRNYFLLKSDNKNQPPIFTAINKVTGILFENKVDHTTYFGGNIEYVQGIHMIPLNPSSAYTRPEDFVTEEWDTYFSNGRVNQVAGGWRGILYANLALIDPQTSYDYFASPNFDYGSLDGGASRTWYLAYSAAMLNMDNATTDPALQQYPQQQPQQEAQPSEDLPAAPQPTQNAPQEQQPQQQLPQYQTPEDLPAPPQHTHQQAPEEQPHEQPHEQPQQPPPQQQPSQASEDFTAAPSDADAPYNDSSFDWSNHTPDHQQQEQEPAEPTEDFPAAPSPYEIGGRNPYDGDPSSAWRNYFNNYRNKALHGDDDGRPRRGNPWRDTWSPYNRKVGASGEYAREGQSEDEWEWEDVLDCGEEGEENRRPLGKWND